MTEGPPVKVTVEGVDAEPRKVGHRYVDWIVAGTAILISLLSLAIAMKHGMIMERLVAANSWPLLQYQTGNANEAGEHRINLSVENAGVGPAIVKHFSLLYNGRRYANANDFLLACCTSDGTLPDGTNSSVEFVEGSVIKAGQLMDYLGFQLTPVTKEVWQRLDRERFKVSFDSCYCSVFGECWRSDLTSVEPRQVEVCPAPIGGNPAAQRARGE